MSILTRVPNPLETLEDNFRRPTGWWGRAVGHLMALQHRTLTEWAIDRMRVRPYDRVLDVGCGGGMALRLLSRRAWDGRVIGVDYSPDMVEQARARNAEAVRRGRVEVHQGDAMALPFPDGSFDQVCAIETFYFWPDPLRGLREAHRVLRPGGRLTVTLEMSREASGRTARQRLLGRRFTERSAGQGLAILSGAELEALLREAGFVDTGYAAQPDRSFGWVSASGRREDLR